MLPHNSYHLLYIQTMLGNSLKTKCCFTTYDMVLPFPIKKVLIYYLEQHQRSYSQQVKLAKRLLAINKLVPLYISNKVILFPVKQQRAPLQVYLNAQAIIGLTSTSTGTIVTFDNSIQFKIDEPYTLVYKKWQESLLLFHLVQKSTTFY
ncbi:competence protein ComK [Staphylococcus croceilyticus]|uniref:Competence protein ComK n=1 Tax=Staphylococcus croceilyticus TaxID=319942 RepID=A0ABY2KEI9_9STAP|nr:competence protein ComK [Staphylococcus croceilyticus]PNZ68768.1 competence protein ComK [Staphylococcus croceilyticus]TGA80220.1 competence protein ComK [Staphylococcus croceilyticus]